MDKALTIRTRRESGYVIVTVAGEIDIATVARLRERLSALAAGGLPLVADLDQVSFIDATGLGALAVAARRAAGPGTRTMAWWRTPAAAAGWHRAGPARSGRQVPRPAWDH